MKDLMLNETKYLITDPEIQQYLPWQSYVVNYAPRELYLRCERLRETIRKLDKNENFS